MGISTDLTNKIFYKLTVLNRSHKTHNGHWVWNCKCECGNEKKIYATNLVRGLTKSCGCYRVEVSGNTNLSHGHSRVGIRSSEYRSWCSALARCNNKKNRKYNDYGGRGIIVCDRWANSFENFFNDMGTKPSKKHSLDRIDVNGNYEPSNCRWATPKEQTRNKRNNIWYEYDGVKNIITDWAIILHTNENNLREMVKYHSFEYAYNFYKSKIK